MVQADKGNKFDMGKVDKVLAHIVDWDNEMLSLLIDRLLQEKSKRHQGRNIDTIQT